MIGSAMIELRKDAIERVLLAAHQFAFTCDGTQVVYNMLRYHVEANPRHVVIEGDESCAFQRASRPEMRRQLMEHLPEFIPYFSGAYDAPARLHHAGRTIPAEYSQHGCQQGCSWGTLLFGLARLRLLRRLINDHPECIILSVSDDIFIAGPPAAAAAAYRHFGLEAPLGGRHHGET